MERSSRRSAAHHQAPASGHDSGSNSGSRGNALSNSRRRRRDRADSFGKGSSTMTTTTTTANATMDDTSLGYRTSLRSHHPISRHGQQQQQDHHDDDDDDHHDHDHDDHDDDDDDNDNGNDAEDDRHPPPHQLDEDQDADEEEEDEAFPSQESPDIKKSIKPPNASSGLHTTTSQNTRTRAAKALTRAKDKNSTHGHRARSMSSLSTASASSDSLVTSEPNEEDDEELDTETMTSHRRVVAHAPSLTSPDERLGRGHEEEEEEDEDVDDEEEDDEEEEDPTVMDSEDRVAEKLEELAKKQHMVESGTLSEYCRRVGEFKQEKTNLLQSAEWHKNLQLKNFDDLFGFEQQKAQDLWHVARHEIKQQMLLQMDALTKQLEQQLHQFDHQIATSKLKSHANGVKKPVVPTIKEEAEEVVNAVSMQSANGVKQVDKEAEHAATTAIAKATEHVKMDHIGTAAVQENGHAKPASNAPSNEAENSNGRVLKRRRIDFSHQLYDVKVPVAQEVSLDDLQSDLLEICRERSKTAEMTAATKEFEQIEYRLKRLYCGEFIFAEGDEVVVSSKFIPETYVGIISSITDDAVYVKLETGQKIRLYQQLIQRKRCDLQPMVRGDRAIGSLQTNGWVNC